MGYMKDRHSLAVALAASGFLVAAIWLTIAIVGRFAVAGLIFQAATFGPIWLWLAYADRKSKVSPIVWAFFVPSLGFGVVAYTLSLAGVSTKVACPVGAVGGGYY